MNTIKTWAEAKNSGRHNMGSEKYVLPLPHQQSWFARWSPVFILVTCLLGFSYVIFLLHKNEPITIINPIEKQVKYLKTKTSDVLQWHRLQKYIVDRFFDAAPPFGVKRRLIICKKSRGCKYWEKTKEGTWKL